MEKPRHNNLQQQYGNTKKSKNKIHNECTKTRLPSRRLKSRMKHQLHGQMPTSNSVEEAHPKLRSSAKLKSTAVKKQKLRTRRRVRGLPHCRSPQPSYTCIHLRRRSQKIEDRWLTTDSSGPIRLHPDRSTEFLIGHGDRSG